jgi:hypothetical protein
MKNWYAHLNSNLKTVVWSIIVVAILVIALSPLFFFSLMEIPLGIALGGSVGILNYLILGLIDDKEYKKVNLVLTIVTIIVRFLVIAGVLILVGFLYYKLNIKLFNIFAVAGSYFISFIVSIFILRKEGANDIH